MPIGSRVIIIEKNTILLIHRIKGDKEYWVLPGGTIEESETFEQTAIREAKEETNLDIELGKLLWDFDDGFGRSQFFLVKNFKGKIRLGGPELKKQNEQDQYKLEWVRLEDLKNLLLYPEEIKKRILETF